MRRTLLALSLALPFAASDALASPEALKSATVDKFRPQADGLLKDAATKAGGLRQKASQPDLLFPGQKAKVRGGLAKSLRGARGELRKTMFSLHTATTEKGHAEETQKATASETEQAKQAQETTHGQLSWLARKLGFAIMPKGRATLARYKQEKAEYLALDKRLKKETGVVHTLGESIETFEKDRTALSQRIGKLRAIDWKGEADKAVQAEVKQLEADAVKVEADAKTSIHSLVSTFVKEQMAPQRDPISAAAREADEADRLGHSASNAISNADTAVRRAQQDERSDQLNDAVEMLVGRNGLQDLARTLGDANAAVDSHRAQKALGEVNDAVSRFQQKMQGLKRMTAVIQHGGGPSGGAAGRVDTNVALVAYVDLALDFTRFDGAFTNFITDEVALHQLGRAQDKLGQVERSLDSTRRELRSLQQALGNSLATLDKDAAEVLKNAVGELTASKQ
jgi:hypothetical protein